MLTGVFRASYAYVFEPQAPQGGGEPKYQITMLIPKTDTATYRAMAAEINRVLQEGVQKVFGGQMPARPRIPIGDGDGVKNNGEPYGEECRGCWVVRASSKTRPSVVDLNIQPIIDPNAFYSGCYARATVSFYAYNQNGNKGVGCGLNNVQKLADGEPLSGRTTAEEDFGGTNAWNGANGYGAQAQSTSYRPVPPAPSPNPDTGYGQPYAPPSAATHQTSMIDPVTGRAVGGGVMGI